MRSLSLAALAAALALPRVALAQTPSVTPTPAPVMLTFRFDCGAIPWSCGDKPSDIRWQLWRGTRCEPSQQHCMWNFERLVTPNEPIPVANGNVRLFLGPINSRDSSVDKCSESPGGDSGKVRLTIFSWCAVNGAACAGPANWNVYGIVDGKLTHLKKHIGDCTGMALGNIRHGDNITMHWGLPGELTAAPTETMTAPPPATPTPTVGIPTDAPTLAVTPTASPTAIDAPTATVTASATASAARTPTATPGRGRVWLPRVGR